MKRVFLSILMLLSVRGFCDSTVVFNEVMYHPSDAQVDLEWIEFHNQMAVNMDLSGWSLAGGIEYTFPEGTLVTGGGYLLVASDPALLDAQAQITGTLGPWEGNLSNAGEEVILFNNSGREMDTLEYDDAYPWTDGADGTGFTLSKKHAWTATGDPANWSASLELGGTPGAANFIEPGEESSSTTLVIPIDAEWSYWDDSQAPEVGWTAVDYNDSSWKRGQALLGEGTITLVEGPGYPMSNPNSGNYDLVNPSFEEGILNPFPGYGQVEGWSGSGSVGNNDGSGPFVNGLIIPDGNRVALIQNSGSLTQKLSGLIPGQKWTVRYRENERGLSSGDRARPSVMLGGTLVVPEREVTRTDRFRHVVSNPFNPTTTTADLVLRNNAPVGTFGDNTVLLDDVVVAKAAPPITDGSFEIPDINGYVYEPGGSAWSHSGGGFVLSDNNSAFGNTPFEGTQAMVLQGAVRVWQQVSGFEIGKTYVLCWAECDRAGLGGNDIQISVGPFVVSPKHVVTSGWVRRTSTPFVALASTYQVSIQSYNSGGGDQSTFIDEVYLAQPPTAPTRTTAIQAGTNAAYFRRTFTFNGNPSQASLLLNAVSVAGAAYYLNGQEILRMNLPNGTLDHTTPATADVISASFTGLLTLPGDALVTGTNLLAVEVHPSLQSPGKSLFGAELQIVESPLPLTESGKPDVRFSEVEGTSSSPFWLEIENTTDHAVYLEDFLIRNNSSLSHQYLFAPSTLAAGARLVLSESQLGFRPSENDVLYLTDSEQHYLDSVRVAVPPRARCGDWEDRWLQPSQTTPNQPNQFDLNDSIVINEIMYHPRPQYARDPVIHPEVLVPMDATWKYDQSNTPHGPEWYSTSFDDSSWPAGKALFYAEPSAMPAEKNTPLTLGRPTHYFRTEFNYTPGGPGTSLVLTHLVDDGAVFYLNGQELLRFNMDGAPAEITHNTLASVWVDNAALVSVVLDMNVLQEGTNLLAVAVKQNSTGSGDVVFGLQLQTQWTEGGTPYLESNQGWVELYNRGAQAVDLGGWRFDKGIDFVFRDGTSLNPGGFLVIAKDPVSLREEFPSAMIVGPYDGNLSGGGELLSLLDSVGNPADEVVYDDEGRWPSYPDGGGHSLELRDPDADNSKPEMWSASIESQNANWNTYSYRGVAQTQPGTSFPAVWNELVMGLLTDGEMLIDDLSVIEDPNGTMKELLQNGSFDEDLAHWRIIGNHYGFIVPDPDDPSNKVLHFKATGATEHMHNHAETTFTGNTPLTMGKEYEISFKARWIAGCPQLNTRLYFNYLPKTTFIDYPPGIGGTPGQANSVLVDNSGPTYEGLEHSPVIPEAAVPVEVRVQASDPDGITEMKTWWRVDGGAWQMSAMSSPDGIHFSTFIPGQVASTVVQFYVEGIDSLGASSFFPAAGPDSRALFTTQDGRTKSVTRHSIRILMLDEDINHLHSGTNAMSNEHEPCTVVYNEREVFYNAHVRLKGSGFGRLGSRLGFNLYFDPDHLFRGVHATISLDRNGGPWNVGASQHELVYKQILNHSGGVPWSYDDVVDVISARGSEDTTAQLLMSRSDDLYFDSAYPNGSDGNLYEFELIYYSTMTSGGSPEGYKLPPSVFMSGFPVLGVDIQNMGDNKEFYRWNYLIKNHRNRDSYERIMQLGKTFSLTGTALKEASENLLDLDQWMRVFASITLGGIADIYHNGLQHNIQLFERPDDNRILAMPWDTDHTFYYGTNSSIYGQGSNLSKIISIDSNKRLFLGHMLDMLNTSFNPTYAASWITHFGAITGLTFNSTLTTYIRDRYNYALSQMPAKVNFSITTNGGKNFSVNANQAVLEGTGWIDVRQVRITGRTESQILDWPFLTTWRTWVTLAPGINPLVLTAYDFQGKVIGTSSITITNTNTGEPLVDHLRLTELMYDPLAGGDYEFLEMQNTSTTQTLNLGGATFSNGITYTFPANTLLAPGGYLVLAKTSNTTAFRTQYGLTDETQVLGGFGGRLANEGEKVTLETYSGGSVIFDLEYGVGRGWPLAANGAGHSLVPLVSAEDNQPYGSLYYGGNWRASAYINGSPGEVDPTPPDEIVINEIKSNTVLNDPSYPSYSSNDWIELYNPGTTPCDISGWYLSDSADNLREWKIPSAVIDSHGIISFDEVTGFHNPVTQGFGLSSSGERLFLSYLPGTSGDRVVDCIDFKGQEANESTGRYPDGSLFDFALDPSRDSTNRMPESHLVISEIMYCPPVNAGNPEDNTAEEFIEIHNPTLTAVPLWNEFGAWRLDGGVAFVLPVGVTLGAGKSLIIVGFDPAHMGKLEAFCSAYGIEPSDSILGPYQGVLSNRGERVALEKPLADPNGLNPSWKIIDEVIYFNQNPWDSAAKGTGLSLQRISYNESGNSPESWMTGVPSPEVDDPDAPTPTASPTSTQTEIPALTPTRTLTPPPTPTPTEGASENNGWRLY